MPRVIYPNVVDFNPDDRCEHIIEHRPSGINLCNECQAEAYVCQHINEFISFLAKNAELAAKFRQVLGIRLTDE